MDPLEASLPHSYSLSPTTSKDINNKEGNYKLSATTKFIAAVFLATLFRQ